MIEYLKTVPTDELIAWVQTDIMPWITAIITGVVMVTPTVATLISRLKAYVATMQSAFDTVKNANDANIEDTQNAIQTIADNSLELFGKINNSIASLPIEEMKKVQVNSCEAIITFGELFKLSFQYLYETNANMQGLSPEAKERNKQLYDKAMSLIADKNLSDSMKKLHEIIATSEEPTEEPTEAAEVEDGEIQAEEGTV